MGNEELRALLTAHQSTVYTLCFQVLRSAADAEDAAQDALLEIARGVGAIREPRAFKRWLCRTTLHTALDHRRRRSRRARHEQARAAMTRDTRDPGRDAVHEALSKLDDDDRCLLVEKYFEGATLETIGAREGVSASAVGKRVDRAKERLKRHIGQAGLPAMVPSVDSILDAHRPVADIPALSLEPALAAAGGSLLGAKSAAVALVALLAVGGGYALVRSRATVASPPPLSSKGHFRFGDAATSPTPHPVVEFAKPPALSELLSRLARFRKWYDEFKPPRDQATFSMDDPVETRSKVRDELMGVRALIFKHPRVFLEWLALPENERCVIDLMAATLGEKIEPSGARLSGFGETPDDGPQNFRDFPSELTDGLLGLLHSGNERVQDAVLRWAVSLSAVPGEWRTRYLALVAHRNEEIWLGALRALLFTGKPTLHAVLHELCRCANAVSRDQLLSGLESGVIPDPRGERVSLVVQGVATYDPSAGEEFEERACGLLLSVLGRVGKEHDYSQVVAAGLQLSPQFAKPIVLKAASDAPTDRLRKAAAAVLDAARMDEENWRGHRTAWMRSMRAN
jgi:RNA polymerase sigma-70 factor, ECF subfamily